MSDTPRTEMGDSTCGHCGRFVSHQESGVCHCATALAIQRAIAAESKVDALMRESEEYRKELGIRQNMTATTRLHNICKGLEYDKKDSPYSAEAWDQLVAENAALEEQIERCAKICEIEASIHNRAWVQPRHSLEQCAKAIRALVREQQNTTQEQHDAY